MGKKQEQANNTMPSSNQREEKTSLMKNKKDIKDLIAPSGIDATSTNHLEIVSYNTKYARTMTVATLPRMCTFPELFRDMYMFEYLFLQ